MPKNKDIELPNESGTTDLAIDRGIRRDTTVRGNVDGDLYGIGHYKGPIEVTKAGMSYRLANPVPISKDIVHNHDYHAPAPKPKGERRK